MSLFSPAGYITFKKKGRAKTQVNASSLLLGEEVSPLPPQDLTFLLFQPSVPLLSPAPGEIRTTGFPSCLLQGSVPTSTFRPHQHVPEEAV